ncbi:hypothetical protein B0H19DRAFT_1367466 [Mycena capillaripes]|nr:hypothetical protein B0H19DRAFT_1367466 [Mycena capillaripes]
MDGSGADGVQANHHDSALLLLHAPQRGWGEWVRWLPQLQELELEFETTERKREELEEQVRVALEWKFPLKDDTSLVHDGKEPVESTWLGTSRFAPGRDWAAWGSAEQGSTLNSNLPCLRSCTQSCRLVYLEMHLAPIALNKHVFWMEPDRGLPGRSVPNLVHNMYFRRMTLAARGIHEWVAGLAVHKLAIIIRYSDWWYWERSEPLRINPLHYVWGKWVGTFPQLQELELEFETIESKKEQLEEQVQIALGGNLVGGSSLVHDGEAPVKLMWMGTSRMSPRGVEIAWGGIRPQDEAALFRST